MAKEWSKEVFARNLERYMKNAGKNQKEMAEIVGVSAPTFNEWIRAKKFPRIDKIEKLADYFGILKSDLIEEKGENKKSPVMQLTEGEELLLELFRSIPDDKRQMAIEMLKVVLQIK